MHVCIVEDEAPVAERLFEIFERVDVTAPVIFTTAYDEYAIDAFKVNSIDYLLKPIRVEDLQRELDPARYFRINRKMIVSMRAIRAMHAWSRSRIRIDLDPPEPKGVEALVSVDRAADFRAWLDR